MRACVLRLGTRDRIGADFLLKLSRRRVERRIGTHTNSSIPTASTEKTAIDLIEELQALEMRLRGLRVGLAGC